jgi:FtsP/CotA-like multicopper oxidase with cupredoxin domain
VITIAEKGKAPSVPAPLIRVETGTGIQVTLHNTLKDSTITFFGLQKRPSLSPDSLVLKPGETKQIRFDAGEPGTYLYHARIGSWPYFFGNEEEQLAGAFIVDPKGGSKPDRVMVVNVFGTPADTAIHKNGYMEALTINGRSWPYTEAVKPSVGDTLRWRIVNASLRSHPMHLHGFNYQVLSEGTMLHDSVYSAGYEKTVVTQNMMPFSTMNMQWLASRPGNWLFHCHLSFHVTTDIRLPGMEALDEPGKKAHMAGLVMPIYIKPGPSDLISKGPAREISLFANEHQSGKYKRNGFSFSAKFKADTNTKATPGPLLVLRQYQPTYVTVTNQLPFATSVHWHGLDLDSWADGVPDFSASDGMMSPSILPGEKFTYKLTLMRPGTYIYHSHMQDAEQIASGLYGPIIVLKENETYDPLTDHYYIVGWKTRFPAAMKDVELNGSYEQPVMNMKLGKAHRLRLINIAPAGDVVLRMTMDSTAVPVKCLAKDGTDLPALQQDMVKQSQLFGVGETGDFEFKPLKPGTYTLWVMYNEELSWKQKWVVTR